MIIIIIIIIVIIRLLLIPIKEWWPARCLFEERARDGASGPYSWVRFEADVTLPAAGLGVTITMTIATCYFYYYYIYRIVRSTWFFVVS